MKSDESTNAPKSKKDNTSNSTLLIALALILGTFLCHQAMVTGNCLTITLNLIEIRECNITGNSEKD